MQANRPPSDDGGKWRVNSSAAARYFLQFGRGSSVAAARGRHTEKPGLALNSANAGRPAYCALNTAMQPCAQPTPLS
jgi:hypothetical protein